MRKSHEFKTKLEIVHQNDSILYSHMMNIVLLALAIADVEEEEAERVQKEVFDNL